MFKAMPKTFWIGMAIVYGYAGLLMMIEWNTPGFPLTKFLGVPACWIYNMIGGCFLLNVFIAWFFAYTEDQRERKLKEKL